MRNSLYTKRARDIAPIAPAHPAFVSLAEEPVTPHSGSVREGKPPHGDLADAADRLGGRVGHDEPRDVGRVDGARRDQALAEEFEQRPPVLDPHQYERKVLDLACLDRRRRLEDLVQPPEAPIFSNPLDLDSRQRPRAGFLDDAAMVGADRPVATRFLSSRSSARRPASRMIPR